MSAISANPTLHRSSRKQSLAHGLFHLQPSHKRITPNLKCVILQKYFILRHRDMFNTGDRLPRGSWGDEKFSGHERLLEVYMQALYLRNIDSMT